MENKIIHADVLDGLKQIPDGTVSLVVSSPPYNLKINYDNHQDEMPYRDYLNWLKEIFIECKRTLRTGGRIAINMATITNRQQDKDKEYFRFLGKHLGNLMDEIGMLPFAEIVWYKQDAAGKKTAWGSYCSCSLPVIRSTHEYIYVFSKDQFKLEGDSELSDIGPKEFNDWTFSTWFISPETRNLGNHPVPYPEELVKRVIKLFSYRGDLILDPFVGTGTTTAVAAEYGRRWLGIDNSETYVRYATKRTEEAFSRNKQLELMEPYVARSIRLKQIKDSKEEKIIEPMSNLEI